MKKYYFIISGLMLCFATSSASAEDATCAKLKNPTYRAVCNCAVDTGGRVEEGRKVGSPSNIRWYPPRGRPPAYMQCISKYQPT